MDDFETRRFWDVKLFILQINTIFVRYILTRKRKHKYTT